MDRPGKVLAPKGVANTVVSFVLPVESLSTRNLWVQEMGVAEKEVEEIVEVDRYR